MREWRIRRSGMNPAHGTKVCDCPPSFGDPTDQQGSRQWDSVGETGDRYRFFKTCTCPRFLSRGDRNVLGADRRYEVRTVDLLALARHGGDPRQQLENVSGNQHFAHRTALAGSDEKSVLDDAREVSGHRICASRITSDPDRALAGCNEVAHGSITGIDFEPVMSDHRQRA